MDLKTFDAAITWWGRGVATIPLWPGEKRPIVGSWKQYQRRLPTADEIIAWFAHHPRNLAVVCGWGGLTVLDFDQRDIYLAWLAKANPPPTYTVRTSRGMHAYYFLETPTRSTKISGVDIQAAGNYVVAPPSIHPCGAAYEVAHDLPVARVPDLATVCPEWMFYERPTALTPSFTNPNPAAPRPENPPSAHTLRSAPPPAASVNLSSVMNALPSAPNLVATIKDRVSLLQFFPNARPSGGSHYLDICPFHDDHDPSFWIDTDTRLCGCFAGCTPRPMDVINLYARFYGLSNGAAIDALRALV